MKAQKFESLLMIIIKHAQNNLYIGNSKFLYNFFDF